MLCTSYMGKLGLNKGRVDGEHDMPALPFTFSFAVLAPRAGLYSSLFGSRIACLCHAHDATGEKGIIRAAGFK